MSCNLDLNTLLTLKNHDDTNKPKISLVSHLFQIHYVVFINCAGTHDIVELLSPEEQHVFFIIDSHRPTDLCNIYSSSQVSN